MAIHDHSPSEPQGNGFSGTVLNDLQRLFSCGKLVLFVDFVQDEEVEMVRSITLDCCLQLDSIITFELT